ncbi:MAG TPA: hypothetical protein VJ810_35970 [Blastocatellia bacterium]|nr:hypothetical protein [Blastocatellia bacterium]
MACSLLSAVDLALGSPGRLDDWRDSGFELQYVLNGRGVHISMIHTENQPFDFYAQVASSVGWLRRLFGYRDAIEVEWLMKALHQALTSSPDFAEIRWRLAWYDESAMSAQP